MRDMREPEMLSKTQLDGIDVVGSPVRFPMEFSRSMQRAADRCSDISRSERVFGYMVNWRVYAEMAEECKVLPAWLFQEITRVSAAGSQWPSFDDAA
jgi:hypothetical protein